MYILYAPHCFGTLVIHVRPQNAGQIEKDMLLSRSLLLTHTYNFFIFLAPSSGPRFVPPLAAAGPPPLPLPLPTSVHFPFRRDNLQLSSNPPESNPQIELRAREREKAKKGT